VLGASISVRPRKSETLLMSARRGTRMMAGVCWKMTANTTRWRPIIHSRRTLELQTPKIRLAARYRIGSVDVRAALANGHVKTGGAIKSLLQRGVVAGKLELVFPFELQGHRIERNGRMRCE
jgi:hypothetical protein